jgi:hypothetical protein
MLHYRCALRTTEWPAGMRVRPWFSVGQQARCWGSENIIEDKNESLTTHPASPYQSLLFGGRRVAAGPGPHVRDLHAYAAHRLAVPVPETKEHSQCGEPYGKTAKPLDCRANGKIRPLRDSISAAQQRQSQRWIDVACGRCDGIRLVVTVYHSTVLQMAAGTALKLIGGLDVSGRWLKGCALRASRVFRTGKWLLCVCRASACRF